MAEVTQAGIQAGPSLDQAEPNLGLTLDQLGPQRY
jgi:hypothetical protein